MTVLIAFATVEGQTEKIARFINDVAKNAGFNAKLININEMPSRVSLDDVVKVFRHPFDNARSHSSRRGFDAPAAAEHTIHHLTRAAPSLVVSLALSAPPDAKASRRACHSPASPHLSAKPRSGDNRSGHTGGPILSCPPPGASRQLDLSAAFAVWIGAVSAHDTPGVLRHAVCGAHG